MSDNHLDLADSPGFLIRRLQQLAVSIFIQSLRDHGITPIQYTILRVIESNPNIDQATLASRSVLDASTVKDVLRRLEARGLVARIAGTKDRRTREVALSEAGRQLLLRAEPQVQASRRRLLAPLAPAENAALLQYIRRLLDAHEANQGIAGKKPWRRL